MKVQRRHIAITGASSGLGAGLAKSYAAAGVTLSLVGRSEPRLAAVAASCRDAGAQVQTGLFDVGAPEPLGDWLRAIYAAEPIDLLIANAGTSAGPASALQPEGLHLASRQICTNLLGVLNTVEPVLPALIGRRRGHIAVVSSVAGYRGLPYSPAYSASKAGVRVYGDALRSQLAPQGVIVSVIIPGFFSSPMTDRFKGATPMLRTLDNAVRTVRRGLDRHARRIVFPRLLGIGIQLSDLIPALLGDVILRRVPFRIDPNCADLAVGADAPI